MEKRGSGLRKICDETAKLPNFTLDKMPMFESAGQTFMTTVYNVNVAQNVAQNINRHQAIVEMITENDCITRKQMAENLGVSKKTIERLLTEMKNIVKYEGSSKNGHWIILKK